MKRKEEIHLKKSIKEYIMLLEELKLKYGEEHVLRPLTVREELETIQNYSRFLYGSEQ